MLTEVLKPSYKSLESYLALAVIPVLAHPETEDTARFCVTAVTLAFIICRSYYKWAVLRYQGGVSEEEGKETEG